MQQHLLQFNVKTTSVNVVHQRKCDVDQKDLTSNPHFSQSICIRLS
jgi:hypothetical protein